MGRSLPEIAYDDFLALRHVMRRLPSGEPVRTMDAAAAFVTARGCCTLGGLKTVPLPSLSEADEQPPWSDDSVVTDLTWQAKEVLPARRLRNLMLTTRRELASLLRWTRSQLAPARPSCRPVSAYPVAGRPVSYVPRSPGAV